MTTQELMKKMRSLCNDSDKILRHGLLKAGEKVRGRAVLLCPVDTGELRNSIKVRSTAPNVVTVGTNKEYAIFVEFGTGTMGDASVSHTSKEKWNWQDEQGNWHTSYGTPAQPFLRPAVKEKEIRETVAAELRRIIENA